MVAHPILLDVIHLGQVDVAERIHNAWKKTIEDGVHTPDIYHRDKSKVRVGTHEFTYEVIQRLGYKPEKLKPVSYQGGSLTQIHTSSQQVHVVKELVGIDVFLDWDEEKREPKALGKLVEEKVVGKDLKLVMITNRGLKVYPQNGIATFCSDHWRCRFQAPDDKPVTHAQILALMNRFAEAGLDFIKTENLYTFDGEIGFSLAQGQ